MDTALVPESAVAAGVHLKAAAGEAVAVAAAAAAAGGGGSRVEGGGGQVGLFIDITSDRLINSHVRKTMCICNHIELHALPEIFRNIFQNSGNKITK